jgi:hypothetical protein
VILTGVDSYLINPNTSSVFATQPFYHTLKTHFPTADPLRVAKDIGLLTIFSGGNDYLSIMRFAPFESLWEAYKSFRADEATRCNAEANGSVRHEYLVNLETKSINFVALGKVFETASANAQLALTNNTITNSFERDHLKKALTDEIKQDELLLQPETYLETKLTVPKKYRYNTEAYFKCVEWVLRNALEGKCKDYKTVYDQRAPSLFIALNWIRRGTYKNLQQLQLQTATVPSITMGQSPSTSAAALPTISTDSGPVLPAFCAVSLLPITESHLVPEPLQTLHKQFNQHCTELDEAAKKATKGDEPEDPTSAFEAIAPGNTFEEDWICMLPTKFFLFKLSPPYLQTSPPSPRRYLPNCRNLGTSSASVPPHNFKAAPISNRTTNNNLNNAISSTILDSGTTSTPHSPHRIFKAVFPKMASQQPHNLSPIPRPHPPPPPQHPPSPPLPPSLHHFSQHHLQVASLTLPPPPPWPPYH